MLTEPYLVALIILCLVVIGFQHWLNQLLKERNKLQAALLKNKTQQLKNLEIDYLEMQKTVVEFIKAAQKLN